MHEDFIEKKILKQHRGTKNKSIGWQLKELMCGVFNMLEMCHIWKKKGEGEGTLDSTIQKKTDIG